MKTILVVDDEKDIRDSLTGVLSDEGYKVETSESAEDALLVLGSVNPDVILLDIWLPGMDGLDMLREVKARSADIPVVMISGHATIDTAVKTTKLGAYDFIEKPLSLEKVILSVEHAVEHKRLLVENAVLRERERQDYNMIGGSRLIAALKADIQRVGPTDSWVLITGENGTGKELVARNVHLHSNRSAMPFVEVNCAAIPEDLIESELFGHEKGAFTSAISQRKGRFDMADKGTIFLDEIGDMSLKTQARILRILQEQSFERVGGTETIKVDVRVIAATNKDLKKEIEKGAFREDLFYRLNVIPFHVPPLASRKDDIPLFVAHFLAQFSGKATRETPSVSKRALKALSEYSWPGNVRELKNLMERVVIMSPSKTIDIDDLPDYILTEVAEGEIAPSGGETLKDARMNFERDFIVRKLAEHEGNIAKTAEAIGVERSHLYRKIKNFGIDV